METTNSDGQEERNRLRFVLVTLAIVATWIVINSFFFTGWVTAAILAFGMLTVDVIYIIRAGDRLLAKFLYFGLVAGFVELLADAWLISSTKTLYYEFGEPLLIESPVYMPVAWAVILVQIGYIGYFIHLRWGLLRATLLTGLLGGAIIPVYEYCAFGMCGYFIYLDIRLKYVFDKFSSRSGCSGAKYRKIIIFERFGKSFHQSFYGFDRFTAGFCVKSHDNRISDQPRVGYNLRYWLADRYSLRPYGHKHCADHRI